jgi:ankyrin repeat protein
MSDITPFSIAAYSASRQTIELLLELGASVQHRYPLHSAVWSSREDEIVELLLNKGASPNAIEFEGQPKGYYESVTGVGTPLHVAYRTGNHRLVKLLLKYGADPNIQDTRGMLPGQVRKNHCHLSASI